MRISFKASIIRTEDMKTLVFTLGQIIFMKKGVDCQGKKARLCCHRGFGGRNSGVFKGLECGHLGIVHWCLWKMKSFQKEIPKRTVCVFNPLSLVSNGSEIW